MPTIKIIVEQSDTKSGKVFDVFVQSLILLSLVTFSIETLPGLSAQAHRWLRWAEIAVVAVFTAEYLLRLIVADRKVGFVFSFFGIVDLLAILPFYLAMGVDLRSIRTFRFLRLFRIFKLTRYSKALRRYRVAISLIKEELILFAGITAMVLYLASVGIYYFENEAQPEAFSSVFTSMWWALVTLTTVGYGDVYPITVGGKVFAGVVVFVGLGVVAVPSGLMASSLSRAREIVDGEAQGGDQA